MIGDLRDGMSGSLAARLEVEDFYYLEADLLDDRLFDQWLELFADDCRYVMPVRRNIAANSDPSLESTQAGQDILWFDEDKRTLEMRVRQLNTGTHWAEEPVSRVAHLISNVRIVAQRHQELDVTSRFLVYRNRVDDETDVLVGRRTDTLRRTDDGLVVAARAIRLEQSVLMAKSLTVFF